MGADKYKTMACEESHCNECDGWVALVPSTERVRCACGCHQAEEDSAPKGMNRYDWCYISPDSTVLYCMLCKTTEPYSDEMLVRELVKQFIEFQEKHKGCHEKDWAPKS